MCQLKRDRHISYTLFQNCDFVCDDEGFIFSYEISISRTTVIKINSFGGLPYPVLCIPPLGYLEMMYEEHQCHQ